VTARLAIAVLTPTTWSPPGSDPAAWRTALAEDVLDVLATLAEVEAAVAVRAEEARLLSQVGWPGLRGYALSALTVPEVLAAAAADGYAQAVLLAPDAPDLPGMLIGKLLRPLTTRPVAAAPAVGAERGLLGLAARLPAPAWLPVAGLDDLTAGDVRAAAPQPQEVALTAGWHRLRAPADLARLDPGLEGWDATRSLLSGRA
jgi:hypothetical protein